MKAFAGMMLAIALAAGIGNEAEAQQCGRKHVTKSGVRHSGAMAKHSSNKAHLTTCVCKAKLGKSGEITRTGKLKTSGSLTSCVCKISESKPHRVHNAGMMKTNTYGGYRPTSTMMNTMDSTDTMFNGNRNLNNSNQNMDLNNGDRNMNNGSQNMNYDNRTLNNGTRSSDSTMMIPRGVRDTIQDNRATDSLNNGSTGEYMDHGK